MTAFRKAEIKAPVNSDHYVRTLMWLRLNIPELKEVSEQQMLLYGRKASEVTAKDA